MWLLKAITMDLYAPVLSEDPDKTHRSPLTPRLPTGYAKTPLRQTHHAYVLEDDEASGQVATEFLKGYGFKTVTWRRSMVEAMKDADDLATGQYDLILLDMMLPDGTGMPLLDRIKRRGCPVPAGLYTGRSNLEDSAFYDNHACDFVFEKPMSAATFVHTLNDLKKLAKED